MRLFKKSLNFYSYYISTEVVTLLAKLVVGDAVRRAANYLHQQCTKRGLLETQYENLRNTSG